MSEQKVWALVMFDVPTQTKAQKRNYTHLRSTIKKCGFTHLQHSVYVRYTPLGGHLSPVFLKIKDACPPGGDVRLIIISDNQWSNQIRISNMEEGPIEQPPQQLQIF